MRIYELIRKRDVDIRYAKNKYNTEIERILKQWFPEYKVNYDFDVVMFVYCDDYWCKFFIQNNY